MTSPLCRPIFTCPRYIKGPSRTGKDNNTGVVIEYGGQDLRTWTRKERSYGSSRKRPRVVLVKASYSQSVGTSVIVPPFPAPDDAILIVLNFILGCWPSFLLTR